MRRHVDIRRKLVINHDVVELVRQRHLRYFGHVVHMMPFRTPNVLLYTDELRAGELRRPVGRPRNCWLDVVGEDCKLVGITLQDACRSVDEEPGVVELFGLSVS